MLEINGYEIIEKIAEGGMSTVWKARQLSLDRLVAIKILDAASLPDQEARDRFRKEAQIAAKLNHPGIVHVLDTGEVDHSAYLVMEYIDGHTVGDQIRKAGALPENRALDIITQVASALAYAWEKECLIHCDIKPDNILVDRVSGVVKVADLGLARLIGMLQARVDSDTIIGTPNYAAPEVSAGETDLDCRTDLYSLGATLYHMVTGVLPFRDAPGSSAMVKHETDYLEDPMVVNPAVSAPAAWLIEKWMVKDRARRPHFWTVALKDLADVRHGHMPDAPLPEAGTSTIRRSSERSLVKNTKPKVVLSPGPDGPRKLTIKKNELPPPPPPPRRGPGVLSRLFGFLFSLSITAAALYGVAWYHGYAPDPRTFFIKGESAETEEATEATALDQPGDDTSGRDEEGTGGGIWRNDDFLQGAKLFNQALADYKSFQQTRSNPSVLTRIADDCRKAIEHFEACRDLAPEHIDIGTYVDQCYGLIADTRHSTQLGGGSAPGIPASPAPARARDDMIVIEDAGGPARQPVLKPAAGTPAQPSTSVVFIDDEAPAEPATTPVETPMLRIALDTGWEKPGPGSFEYANDLRRLLARHTEPSSKLEVDASVVLYTGIVCMNKARDAARVLKQDLPIRRPLMSPGFPSSGLFYYDFRGDFSGASQLTLVVDMNDRVLMVQLSDDREVPARMEAALFSSNWKALDFIHARKRTDADGLIAHRVRRTGNLIRIDSELAVGGTSEGERKIKSRVMLMMPVQMAGVLLQTASASP